MNEDLYLGKSRQLIRKGVFWKKKKEKKVIHSHEQPRMTGNAKIFLIWR